MYRKRVHTLTQAGIWTTDFAVLIACHGREGMFLHVVSRGSSRGRRHADVCSTVGTLFPGLFSQTVGPGTKGVDVLMSSGLGGVLSPPLKNCSRSLW